MSGKNKNRKKPTRGTQSYRIKKMLDNMHAFQVRNQFVRRKRKQK